MPFTERSIVLWKGDAKLYASDGTFVGNEFGAE